MNIGIVDLDTSHPEMWIPILRDLGHDVKCVWDGGSVHPPDYIERFADEFCIPTISSSLEEMAVDEVDCAILHGCDWDTHVEKARAFADAGKAILVDKPLAGRLRDLHQWKQWSAKGIRITGGSSLAYCREVKDWLALPVEERGFPLTVVSTCAVDEFNYGIHAYAALRSVLGDDARSVRHLGTGPQRRVAVDYGDGRMGLVLIGTANTPMTFQMSITTDRGGLQFDVDTSQLYRDFLTGVLPYLGGATSRPPVSIDELLAPEIWALAAKFSWLNDNCEVDLNDESIEMASYDGKEFAREYRARKYLSNQKPASPYPTDQRTISC